jgi:hypothetical protein
VARLATPAESEKLGVYRGRPRKYPWDKWANGKTWVTVKGEDFTCSTHQFQVTVHAHARYHGMIATTITNGDSVTFRITAKEAE